MVEIKLHNSRTRKKELFTPIDAGDVRMYVCGPTVYDRAHLGNARPVVVFDVLYRLLRHVYGADHVKYVRNFTDVDDKINARATRDGRSIREITDETIGWYHSDMEALGTLRPDLEPRATEFIPQMVAMIERLIAKGHAYEAEGHVLFSVGSYANYGALSGRTVEDMIAGARVEVAPYKRDPMDFVLWKPSSDDLPGWDSPWGRGRPGWHIECSAMSYELLGESFDIHGGGIDLQFPHHENEIAQSCCAHPEGGFANVWLHNEMLQVEGKKMSKSLGNFFTVRDLLEQGVPGEVIRMVFLGTHYGKPMDWTEKKRAEAEATLRKWRGLLTGAKPAEPHEIMITELGDDLNTSKALYWLRTMADDLKQHQYWEANEVTDLVRTSQEVEAQFVASANLLGLLLPRLGSWVKTPDVDLSDLEVAL
jgi:cysteinyl-tRNA synthetase